VRLVPLARRILFSDRRRTALSVSAVSGAFVLVLVLGGIFEGAMEQVTQYIHSSPASIFVVQKDVSTMHMTSSVLPSGTVERVRAVDGVSWAEGIHFTTSAIDTVSDNELTYVFGYDPAIGIGGPRELTRGAQPRPGEIVVDRAAASDLDIDLGDRVAVLGRDFVVSGLSSGGTNIVNTSTFITTEDFELMRGTDFNYVLAGVNSQVDEVRARIESLVPDASVMTKPMFEKSERSIVRSMAADILSIITSAGFLIALALVSLTLYNSAVAHQRDFGIAKALGSSTIRLVRVVILQMLWIVILSGILAILTSRLVALVVESSTSNISIALQPRAVMQLVVGALVVGTLASVIPIRRVVRVDVAIAFSAST
jgi:putative ABC transport system permease protein